MTLIARVPLIGSGTDEDPYRPAYSDDVDGFSVDTTISGEGVKVELRGPESALNDVAEKIENERAIEVIENKAGGQS